MKKLCTLIPLLLWLANSAGLSQAQSRGYTIQTASRQSETEARAEMAKLLAAGLPAHLVRANVKDKGIWFRVRFGRFSTLAEAQLSAEQAHKSGVITDYIVTLYETPLANPTPRNETTTVDAKPLTKPTPKASTTTESSKTNNPKESPASLDTNPRASKETAKTTVSKNSAKTSAEKAPEAASKPVDTATPNNKTHTTPQPGSEPPTVTPKQAPSEAAIAAKTNPTEATAVPKPTGEPDASDLPPHQPSAPATEAGRKPTDNEMNPEKVSPVPRIAQPPVPDALGNLDISNRNWKVVRRSNATDKNLRTIFFVDSMTGWAAGDAGVLYRTTDGGKAWKPLLSGAVANINQIFFVDWNTGWMLGEMTRRDDDELETVLLSTTNGGRSWQKKSLPNVLSIFFTDALHGWAVGKNATLLRTEDGGKDWNSAGTPEKVIGHPVESSNYNFGFRDIFFLDAQHGWLVGNFYGRAKSNIGGLFITEDGGATWKRVPLTLQTKYATGRFTPGVLYAVRFSDLNSGTLTGEMYDGEERFFFSLHTRDGGKSWEQYRTPSQATHSTQFLDSARGWTAAAAPREGGADAIVYDTTLMRTDNGGASWRNDFTARGSRIRGVFFLSATKGWAVGDRGMILRYEEKVKSN